MGNVVSFAADRQQVGDGLSVPVNGVLAGARRAAPTQVVVVGIMSDGTVYLAASHGTADNLVALKRAERILLDGYDD